MQRQLQIPAVWDVVLTRCSPGALVLAHSLRDAGTTKKLAILVTLDTVSADVVTQLKAGFLHPHRNHMLL